VTDTVASPELTKFLFWIVIGSYDATPSDYVSLIITDYGMVSQFLISKLTCQIVVEENGELFHILYGLRFIHFN
jgi:translation initiation factor 2B subunit (eIF-2B alpha/beta/delta family)